MYCPIIYIQSLSTQVVKNTSVGAEGDPRVIKDDFCMFIDLLQLVVGN